MADEQARKPSYTTNGLRPSKGQADAQHFASNGEIDLSIDAVRCLLVAHVPRYSELPITELATAGTQYMVYRLGRDLCVRLPRRKYVVSRLENELRWLPTISQHVPLDVPTPVVAIGSSAAFPMPWAIYSWIEGQPLSPGELADEENSAIQLAAFIAALQKIHPGEGPPSQQDHSMADRDEAVRQAIPLIDGILNRAKLVDAWEQLFEAMRWNGAMTWTHGDLLPPNLILRSGRLSAVIDFGCAGIGDPALDLISAWAVFRARGRAAFRRALSVDEATWRRGQAFALYQAIVIAADQLAWHGPMLTVAMHMGKSVLSEIE